MSLQSLRRPRRASEERAGAVNAPSFESAVALWEAGDFELCLRALEELSADGRAHTRYLPPAILLRGRALLRTGRVDEARDWLTSNSPQFVEAHGDAHATYAMLLGQACATAKAFPEADAWFLEAKRCEPHSGISAEIDYSRALALYQQGDYAAAREEINRALPLAPDILHARMRALRGWVATAQSQFAEAHHEFDAAMLRIRQSVSRDTHLLVSTVYALAIGAGELQLGNIALLEDDVSRINWTTNLAGEQTQVWRHLGLAHRHAGDRSRAIDCFIISTEAAPGTPWELFGIIECANLALSRGEDVGPRAMAARAAKLAARHSWNKISGEMRFPLLLLAQLFARLQDGDRAESLRALYYEDIKFSPMNALKHDGRLLNFERHVEACVMGALGERDEACSMLDDVFREWSRIGFKFRAEEAKEDLLRINPRRDEHRGAAVRPRLSIREEQMLALIVDGKTNSELAAHFHIACNTVKNNVLQLYVKFDVHGRTQLVVKARHLISGHSHAAKDRREIERTW